MIKEVNEEKKLLAHHEQLPLCTTRLGYRQGRKLTAVKVYTINNESNHLLAFGVPSLNLRQETKALFMKFGKLLHFSISTDHPAEEFTETYRVTYERIQSARIAKRMLDTKNFYGGSLHVCYAPEFESINETRSKLLLRKQNVSFRLRNLQKEADANKIDLAIPAIDNTGSSFNEIPVVTNTYEKIPIINEVSTSTSKHSTNKKLYMGVDNIIYFNKTKRKSNKDGIIEKRFKPCFEDKQSENTTIENTNKNSISCTTSTETTSKNTLAVSNISINTSKYINPNASDTIEVIDCTSAEKDVHSNINEALNYDKFGNEDIRKVETKPLNKIVFLYNKMP